MADASPTRRGFLGLFLGLLGLPAAVKAMGGEPRLPEPSVEFVKVWVTEEMLDDVFLGPPGCDRRLSGGDYRYWQMEAATREGS